MRPILHPEICTLAANLIQFWTQKFDHWRRKRVARARGSDTIVVSISRRHVRDIAHPPPAIATLLTDWQLVVGCSNVSAGLWSTLQHRWKRRPHLLRLQGLCSQGGARLAQTPHAHTPEERSRTFGAHSQRILNSVRHQVELICVSILEKQNGVHFWTQQVTRHAQTYAHTHAGFVPKEVRV